MEAFTIRLNSVKDAYYGFIVAVLTYVKKKTSRLEAVEAFLNDNPNALSADILGFISEQDDFFEDATPTRKIEYGNSNE